MYKSSHQVTHSVSLPLSDRRNKFSNTPMPLSLKASTWPHKDHAYQRLLQNHDALAAFTIYRAGRPAIQELHCGLAFALIVVTLPTQRRLDTRT